MDFVLRNGEQEFLDEVLTAPDDDAARLIYADWLEAEGDPRAEYLRCEVELHGQSPESAEYVRAQKQLLWMRPQIHPVWMAIVARSPVENSVCQRVEFRYECPRTWENLTPTKEAAVRYCDTCRQRVYYCTTVTEARRHVHRGRCIAVDPAELRVEGDLSAGPIRALRGIIRAPRPKNASE